MSKKTAVIRFIIALAITSLCCALGAFLGTGIDEQTTNLFGYLALGVTLFWLVLIPVNIIAKALYAKSKRLSVRQRQEYYLSRRDEAINDLPRTVRKMVLLRHITECYSALLLLSGLFVAFAIGVGNTTASYSLAPFYLIYGFIGRLSPRMRKFKFEGYTDPADYPVLHSLAHRAAALVGMDGSIRIRLIPDSNAGIAKVGNKSYSLQLGVQLLDVLDEDELYQILIHEFAHLTKDGNPSDKEYRLFAFITEREDNSLTSLLNILFGFTDVLYVFEYFLYRMTASLAIEQIADSAILKNGNPQSAVNALAKTNYYYLFDKESGEHIEEHFYAPTELRSNAIRTLCDAFRTALGKREAFWRELLMHEIQPRSASHPIFRNRMSALGICDYSVSLPDEEGAFRAECRRAVDDTDKELYEARKDSYAEERVENYVKPLAVVESWRASNTDPTAEQSRPLMDALLALGYTEELEALCDRIIEHTQNVWATPHAHMVKGTILLTRYDKAGIDHIYRAIELNKNYLEEGLNAIGEFCCLMGLQEELDIYREKAVELQQNYEDEYRHTGELNAADRLARDDMPSDMLNGILAYIQSIDEGKIKRIYLVKKIISDTFFSSVFVVEFKKDTDEESAERVLDKIFNHLDTHPADRQFSLFTYDERIGAILKRVNGCVVYDAKTQ